MKKALADVRKFHGQPQGMYGADEPMHGPDPTQGIELCSVVEMMFSLETMLAISGDLDFADHLERVAYNALPAQTTEDFNSRQYFQTANQVLLSRARRNFYEDANHQGTDSCFGLLTGYPCCTCNMHQGWPKLVQNLWYATHDRSLAALVYALRIEEDWRQVAASDAYGAYSEIHPKGPWNYGLLETAVNRPKSGFRLARQDATADYPWTMKAAPVELHTQGRRIPEWQLCNHRAGPLPRSPAEGEEPTEDLRLVPYGCSRLRITEFPVVRAR